MPDDELAPVLALVEVLEAAVFDVVLLEAVDEAAPPAPLDALPLPELCAVPVVLPELSAPLPLPQ